MRLQRGRRGESSAPSGLEIMIVVLTRRHKKGGRDEKDPVTPRAENIRIEGRGGGDVPFAGEAAVRMPERRIIGTLTGKGENEYITTAYSRCA